MIEARKSRLFNGWFASHARRRIQGTFGRILVSGLERTARLVSESPVLVVSNHTSWWDPLVILHACTHLLRADAYAMMDAKNLRRLPFFGLVGAFGVDIDHPMDGVRAIRYAAKLLNRPRRLVWIFPQGEERPVHERPLRFRQGAAEVARLARGALTIPAALRYDIAGEEMPRLYLSFGEPLPYERDVSNGRAAHENAVCDQLSIIDTEASGAEFKRAVFNTIHERRSSMLARTAEACLAWMTRPFVL